MPSSRWLLLDAWEAELNATYLSSGRAAAADVRQMLRSCSRVCGRNRRVRGIRCLSLCGRRFGVRHSARAFCRSADRVSPGPDGHALSRHSTTCWAIATIRQIRSAIWCCISAAIAMPSGSSFPTTPAPRCSWRTSGRMSPWTTRRGGFICRWKTWRSSASAKSDIAERRATPQFLEMMKFEVERAREWFQQGLPLAKMVDKHLALDIELFSRGGLEILNAIERQGYDVLTRRPAISKPRKLWLVARAAVGKLL